MKNFTKLLINNPDQSDLLMPFLNVVSNSVNDKWTEETLLDYINENPNLFFSIYKSEKFILEDLNLTHFLYGVNGPINERISGWQKLSLAINEIYKNKYNKNWGELSIKYNDKIKKYLPLIDIKTFADFKNLCKNRPLYINDKFIGYISQIKSVEVKTGSYKEYDAEEFEYINKYIYKSYHYSIVLYNEAKKCSKVTYLEYTNHPVILNERIERIHILEDKVIYK